MCILFQQRLGNGCIKEILTLTFIPHSIKLLIEKCSNLTPALNTIRNRHYSTIGEFDKEDKFYQFCKESSPTVQSTDTLFASGSCTPTKMHFPYTDQMTFAPIPPPKTHPRKKKGKKKGRKSIGRGLELQNFVYFNDVKINTLCPYHNFGEND